jgi:membrane-bound serine protease (ClpP class)
MVSFFGRVILEAENNQAEALLIQLNTPGGALDATLSIVQLFRNARIPVIIYIAPAGAQAASAGSVITLAAHAAGMAPETVVGAASPVMGTGEDIAETLYRKVVEDMKATVRGLADRRGEAAVALAESMIENAEAVTAQEALAVGFVDVVAADTADLLRQLDGRMVVVQGVERPLQTATAEVVAIQSTAVEAFLYGLATILMNPLFISALIGLGVQAIIYEFSNPGGWVAGFIGVLCIALALYGLGQLPANYFGLALVVLAFVLFIMELFTPTYGALAITGAVTLLAGLLITFNSPGTPEYARISVVGAVIMSGSIAGFFLFLFSRAFAAQKLPPAIGAEGMVGRVGRVRGEFTADNGAYSGEVFVFGARWHAEADEPLASNTKVTVQEMHGLTLRVKKL